MHKKKQIIFYTNQCLRMYALSIRFNIFDPRINMLPRSKELRKFTLFVFISTAYIYELHVILFYF